MNHSYGVAAAGLLLLCSAASADPSPTNQPSPPPLTVTPGASVVPVTPSLPVQPAPAPVNPPVAPALPVQQAPLPAAPSTTTITIPVSPPAQKAPPPPLGSELRNKLKVDEQHFIEKSAAAKLEFDQRELAERKEYDATIAGKGFWERRRLTKEFRAQHAKLRREFNDEQEAKRKTYEWRYP